METTIETIPKNGGVILIKVLGVIGVFLTLMTTGFLAMGSVSRAEIQRVQDHQSALIETQGKTVGELSNTVAEVSRTQSEQSQTVTANNTMLSALCKKMGVPVSKADSNP